jgi:AcrR family transcriptional regulator
MKSEDARPYSSPLRAEQAAATRERIVDAAVELLQGTDPGAFGMQDVADRAGVSVSTAYRAFPTKDDLIAGVLEAIKARFEAVAGSPPTTREELQASVPSAVRAVYELEPQYRALFATAAGREAHRTTAGARSASVDQAFADGLDGMDERQRRLVTSMLYLVTSSKSVLWLKDYADLDVDEAADAIAWALAALTAAADKELER